MATIVLSAAGMALGGAVGGSLAGLSSAVIGRAVGASLGRAIDQKVMGSGSETVETGRVDRFRLTGASEGSVVPQIFGQLRTSGQVIWASEFLETKSTSGGGKGSPSKPKTVEYSYSVNVAIALCEGVISRVGRVWADGVEVARDDLNMSVYTGSEDQLPDAKMEAVEGVGEVPAYRGIAYVVLEDLQLEQFGNRVPQFSFEVARPAEAGSEFPDMAHQVRAVAMMPGTGEYALATRPVYVSESFGKKTIANINSPSGKSDFSTSVETLVEEIPACGSVSLVVSWFGNDLRCGSCELKPKVERDYADSQGMPWRVSGLNRGAAEVVALVADRPIYGGTPADASVIEAIFELKSSGQEVVFYPFILMEQLDGNGLSDPWSDATDQAVLPWRGRITTSKAPGIDGSPDNTASADAEVAAFFGAASGGDFSSGSETVSYSGPSEWSYRRFILHYAHLCAAAGGVDAFCIGSEMRSLTQIRGTDGRFVAVEALELLASDVRAILGPDCKIGYAADWSEYFGYQPQDGSGDRYFHLDALWAHAEIDFIGIDNYMPLSDWRDGESHLDIDWGSIYNLDYLSSNIEGGEGYDWYYHSPEAREAQIRTEITDDAYDEAWIWRYKDIRNWWQNAHHERVGGVRSEVGTSWEPESKPIWFTEIGCAAIDKATNQPNKFLDEKSSESSLPHYSNGLRDEFIQSRYLQALYEYYARDENNPSSLEFGHQMVDMGRAHVWAWDARPYPFFPNNRDLWSDGENHARGHWITGRATSRTLASVVAEICTRSGLASFEVSELYGMVRGYQITDTETGRAALQPLMLTYGFDAVERDGVLIFATRNGVKTHDVSEDNLALSDEKDGYFEVSRAPSAEVAGRVRLSYIEAGADYEIRNSEAIFPDEATVGVSQSEVPLALTSGEGLRVAERWLSEARVARDSARFALPPSRSDIGAGDILEVGDQGLFRVDRVEQAGSHQIEAVRIEPETYRPHEAEEDTTSQKAFVSPVPVEALFMDLPLIKGDEEEHVPHVAMTGVPWPGSAALYSAAQDSGYALNQVIVSPSTMGLTETAMFQAPAGLWDRGPVLRVKLVRGALSSASQDELLSGSNLAAIGDGTAENWELFQFSEAVLVAEDTYELSLRLRGQLGSDGIMPDSWPIGSRFVLFDGVPNQITLSANARDLARHYRYGPALRALDDPSYQYEVHAFKGIGLRPYAPVHVTTEQSGGGDIELSWIRRTRIDGDGWSGLEVPLGEDSESYLVQVLESGTLLREEILTTSNWTYSAADQTQDGASGTVTFSIAQISARFGAGVAREHTWEL